MAQPANRAAKAAIPCCELRDLRMHNVHEGRGSASVATIPARDAIQALQLHTQMLACRAMLSLTATHR
jgi:hypothetical protein